MIKSEKGTVVFEGRMEHLIREIFGTQGGTTCT
mgnify:CR=1 FL=1